MKLSPAVSIESSAEIKSRVSLILPNSDPKSTRNEFCSNI